MPDCRSSRSTKSRRARSLISPCRSRNCPQSGIERNSQVRFTWWNRAAGAAIRQSRRSAASGLCPSVSGFRKWRRMRPSSSREYHQKQPALITGGGPAGGSARGREKPRATKAGKVLSPHRMRGIEGAAETEPDVEVGVVEQHPCPGQPGQDGDGAGEVKLETEEGSGVRQHDSHHCL